MIVWLAARRVDGLPRWVRNVALATALGTIAQIPLGGITVLLDLHPIAVMSHFLLALVVARRRRRRRARGVEPRARARASRPGRTGSASSRRRASPRAPRSSSPAPSRRHPGPHPGGQDIRGSGSAITDTVYVHVRATAVFGIGFLIVGIFLWRLRRELSRDRAAPARCCSACSLVQMAVGRDPVPQRLAVVARRDPRLPRGDDLGADGRDRVRPATGLAGAPLAAPRCPLARPRLSSDGGATCESTSGPRCAARC